MFSDFPAFRIEERARTESLWRFLHQERAIVALGDKTDFLAFFHFIGRQVQLFRAFPHLRFLKMAHGKQDMRKPCGREPVQKIGLLFLGISPSKQANPVIDR